MWAKLKVQSVQELKYNKMIRSMKIIDIMLYRGYIMGTFCPQQWSAPPHTVWLCKQMSPHPCINTQWLPQYPIVLSVVYMCLWIHMVIIVVFCFLNLKNTQCFLKVTELTKVRQRPIIQTVGELRAVCGCVWIPLPCFVFPVSEGKTREREKKLGRVISNKGSIFGGNVIFK